MNRNFSVGSTKTPFEILLILSLSSVWGSEASSRPETILGTYVNLLAVNVLVLAKNTGMPLTDLRNEDFEIFNDGHLVRASVFINGLSSNGQPLALWLVAECPQKASDNHSSSSLAGKVDSLKSALEKLNARDTVGVAHWCGDKEEAKIDLAPTQDREALVQTLRAVLQQDPVELNQSTSNRGVQKVLQLIHANTSNAQTSPFTAIVFWDWDEIAVSKDSAESMAKDVISHASFSIFEINQNRPPAVNFDSSLQVSLIEYLTRETGGQVLAAGRDMGWEPLEKIIVRTHSRYLIGVFAPPLDGKWHALKVKLAEAAILKYGEAELRYHSGYSGAGTPPRYSVSETPQEGENSLDSSLSTAIGASATKAEIRFEAEGAAYEGLSERAQFTLKVDGEPLSWTALGDGNDGSKISILTAFLSAQGEMMEGKVRRYEVVRRKNDAWTIPIVISIHSEFPAGADRIRFVIRDDATGRIGIQDLAMRKVLDAPKLPKLRAIIAGEQPAKTAPASARRSSFMPSRTCGGNLGKMAGCNQVQMCA
jgi:hypothetical protein